MRHPLPPSPSSPAARPGWLRRRSRDRFAGGDRGGRGARMFGTRATRAADDGCNQCTCTEDHTWSCTEMVCVPACERGDTRLADDGCNECTCLGDGTWHCEDEPCEPVCEPGETRPGENGSPDCTCDEDGTWLCPPGPECTRRRGARRGRWVNTCTCDILLDGGSPPEWSAPPTRALPVSSMPCTPGDTRLADDGCKHLRVRDRARDPLHAGPARRTGCAPRRARWARCGTWATAAPPASAWRAERWQPEPMVVHREAVRGSVLHGLDQELVNADGWFGNDPRQRPTIRSGSKAPGSRPATGSPARTGGQTL
jgi:hypothetical protein